MASQPDQQQQPDHSEPPNTFTGWGLLSVIGCTIIQINTWGSNSAYALYYQNYVNDNVFPGATAVDYGIIGGLAIGSGMILSPLLNIIIARLGVKKTIFLGALIQFAGVLLASFTTKIWQLYLTQGLLQGLGMAFIGVTSTPIVPQWFKAGPGGKQNLAMGIQTAGTGIGGIIYNIGMEPIMNKHSWRWALRAQAIICFALNIVALFLVRTRNKNVKPVYKIYDREIYSMLGVHCLTIWVILTMFGYVTMLYNLGDFARSLGYTSKDASIVSTMVSVGSIFGRPVVGILADKIGPVQATIATSLLVVVFVFAMWLPCKNLATAIAFALIQGAIMGTLWMTIATMNRAIVGLKKLAIAVSITFCFVGVAGFAGPIIASALRGSGTHAYRNPTIFVGCCYFGGAISLCVLRGWLVARNKQISFMAGLVKRSKV